MAAGVTLNVYGHLFGGAQAQLTEDFDGLSRGPGLAELEPETRSHSD